MADQQQATRELLLYAVPATQPALSSQAKIYGGYHITLYPTHTLPANYSLKEEMASYPKGDSRFTLQADAKQHSQYGINFLDGDHPTLHAVLQHLGQRGSWNAERMWLPLHMTLGQKDACIPGGEPVSADELSEIMRREPEWFLQLVEKCPRVPVPRSKTDYEYRWLPQERIPLFNPAE
eukprot:m.74897 g.74897  ORF g.74897 m.74897 type:complete len:179 (+) comp12419_c0_seq1:121-657(+)